MANFIWIRNSLALLGTTVFLVVVIGVSAHASDLEYNPDGTVVGYSLPGLRPAGGPNFENDVSVRWIQKGPGGKAGNIVIARTNRGDNMYLNMSPTESYMVTNPSYFLIANFNSQGDMIGRNSVTIRGSIDDSVFGQYSGLLMTADLAEFAYGTNSFGEDLLGFNTENIFCPHFDFCTINESAYLNLGLLGLDADMANWGSFVASGTAVTTIPVPAAVWLFGSGLLGLLGIARRRRQV
ncbi:MAG: hypothetical protein OEN52_04965 [Gammaproteobacteria bacterium]|nr:hypothetical protein [Gammaproteobacteria bacterium]MDH3560288.1 hypothetical protein [Gammaproteobacteria bacterium]